MLNQMFQNLSRLLHIWMQMGSLTAYSTILTLRIRFQIREKFIDIQDYSHD